MALRKIARMGHPVLRRVAAPIEDPTDPAIRALAVDMVETMLDAPGVGLAAPQIYESKRMIVFRVPGDRQQDGEAPGPEGVTVLVNPVVEIVDGLAEEAIEGCLSIPEMRGVVPRPRGIRYRGVDLAGRPVEREATGFHARVVLHEVDHLDGILFFDRMTDLARLAVTAEAHHLLDRAAGAPGDPPLSQRHQEDAT